MIYTSARFADPAHTQVTGTDAQGNTETVPLEFTLFRLPEHGPQGFLAGGGVIEEYLEPPPGPYRLYKSILIRRLSALEAEALEVILNGEEPWLRMLYHSVEYFVSDDALFTYLHFVLEANLGSPRADELLQAGPA